MEVREFLFLLQNCTDLILYSEWKSNVSHTYYDAYLAATDYGVCCFIQPYLDFENEETINLHPTKYTPKHYWAVKKGSRNGIQNGLKLLVDVDGESRECSTIYNSSNLECDSLSQVLTTLTSLVARRA